MDENAEIFIFERSGNVSFANCGLPYYLGGVIADRRRLLVATPERFRDFFRVEVRTWHEVQRLECARRTIEVKNLQTGAVTTEHYDALVLATGAVPLRPPLAGIDLPGIFALRDLDDVDRIHAWIGRRSAHQAVIVGAGYIGLEMAENLTRRGMAVTLLEMAGQVMPPADPEMVAPIEEELRRQGVDLRLGDAVAGFERGGGETITVLTKNGARLPAEVVILSVGVKPDARLAREAGLAIGPTGGIRVDDQMRTSDPAVFAVGDAVEVREVVTGLPALIPLAGPANRQGRVAADAIAGRPARFRGAQATAVVGVFDLTLAMTGATEKSLRRNGIAFEKSYTHSAHHASYYPGAERITMKLLFSPESGRVLGAQAVGRQGVEKRIDVLAMAIQMKATVFDLEEAELCYAPQYGSAKDPVNMAGFVAGNILRGDVAVGHWDQWKRAQAAGQAPVTLDVRPPTAVAAESIPGTIRIPLAELRTRLDELPRDQEIWVHCAVGQTSYNAVRLLTQHGFQVRNLSGGITSYKLNGDRA
jgi:NADPH-dependent 2,4-dienoyl-CoA reductase/sulfur reductase-like enzyme/rhodanese-related sulfurtransferase